MGGDELQCSCREMILKWQKRKRSEVPRGHMDIQIHAGRLVSASIGIAT